MPLVFDGMEDIASGEIGDQGLTEGPMKHDGKGEKQDKEEPEGQRPFSVSVPPPGIYSFFHTLIFYLSIRCRQRQRITRLTGSVNLKEKKPSKKTIDKGGGKGLHKIAR
jgi:hypothetical protein